MARRHEGDNATDALMGVTPVPKLLMKIGAPMMLSLLMHALYNFVDSMFVARLSEDALTALSIAAPVQMLMSALGCGVAVGFNAAASKAMGERNEKKVRDTASAALFLALCAYLVIALSCLLFAESYFAWQSGGNRAIFDHGTRYLRVCMLGSLGMMGQWALDRMLIATGRTGLFFIALSVASLVNVALDPLLIFGFHGFPAMGTEGAAVATVTGQFCGALVGLRLTKKRNPEIPYRFTLRPDKACVGDILRVGLPTAALQSAFALSGILMNTLLRAFSSTAVAIMGVCNRIQSIAVIPTHGIDNGLIPVIAYNYGAKNTSRVKSAIRWAIGYSLFMLLIVTAALEIFPESVLSLFKASDDMLRMGAPAVRILAAAYLLSVLGMVLSTAFQALGAGAYGMYLSLARMAALPLLFGRLLSMTGELTWVWAAFPLAEIASMPLAFMLLGRVRREKLTQAAIAGGS